MNNIRKTLGGLIAGFSLTSAASAVTLDIVAPSTAINASSSFTVDVLLTGLTQGSAPSLGAYDLTLEYDMSVLEISGVAFGDQLDLGIFGSDQFFDDSISGQVDLVEVSFEDSIDLDTLQLGDFIISTLSFTASSPGVSAISISVNDLSDAAGGLLLVDNVSGGSVTVNANAVNVPLPNTVWLIVCGLVGFWRWKHRTIVYSGH